MTRGLVCILLFLPVLAAGQTDWNITGAGARAEGFGGAFIGVADDATAIVWNPAGLGQLARVEATAVARYITSSIKYDDSKNSADNSTFNQSHFAFNFASVSVPLHAGRITIVPAVAYQKQLDFYGLIEIKEQDYKWESSGGVQTLTPGVGFKLHPMFFVGGAVNIWMGKSNQTEQYPITFSQGGGTITRTLNAKTSSTYKGLNFGAGVLVDFEGMKKTPFPLRLGVSVKTPFDLKREGDIDQFLVEDPSIKASAGFTQTIEMPFMLGFGASYRIGENLTLASDYEIRAYGDKKITGTYDGTPVDTVNLSDAKKNLNQFRVGAEYLFVADFGVIPLRAGFRTNPTLLANQDVNGDYTDQVVGNAFSVGTGFISEVLAVDIAFSRLTYKRTIGPDVTVTTSNNTFSGSVIVYF
jgi:long-subunit fatty acid transport protein